jgi:hypothetical protein
MKVIKRGDNYYTKCFVTEAEIPAYVSGPDPKSPGNKDLNKPFANWEVYFRYLETWIDSAERGIRRNKRREDVNRIKMQLVSQGIDVTNVQPAPDYKLFLADPSIAALPLAEQVVRYFASFPSSRQGAQAVEAPKEKTKGERQDRLYAGQYPAADGSQQGMTMSFKQITEEFKWPSGVALSTMWSLESNPEEPEKPPVLRLHFASGPNILFSIDV